MYQPVRLLGHFPIGRTPAEALGEPPPRTLPRIGHEKHLEVGIGKYRRTNVSAVDDDVSLEGGRAHPLVDPGAHARHLRNPGDMASDLGPANLLARVDAVEAGD